MYLLGIDTGTTNWKANLYDYKGKLVASAKLPTQTKTDGSGRHYYDPEGLWKSVCSLTRQVVKQIRTPEDISAVGFASMGEAGLLVDSCGNPVTDIIPWYDSRSLKEKEWLEEKLGKFNIFKTTGIFLTPIYSATKILWLKKQEKAAFKRSAKWLCLPDYLIYRFTGEYATDYSIATRTAAFDIKNRKWSSLMLEALGVGESFFAKASASGTIVGRITRKAAEESGLAVGTKIGLGGHDHVVGSYGIGMFRGGDLLDSIGTAEGVVMLMNDYGKVKQIYDSGFSMGCYTGGEMYYIMSGINCSGGLTEWFLREFYDEKLSKEEKYSRLAADLKKAKSGSGGVLTLPFWLGRGAPFKDSLAKGAILGLTPNSTKSDILGSLYEGLSYEFRQTMEAMQEAAGVKVKNLNVIGGGTRNNYWMTVKANITGKKLVVPQVRESVCFGAALLAGVGAGEIKVPKSVTDRLKKKYFTPDKSKTAFHNSYYGQHYKEAGQMLLQEK